MTDREKFEAWIKSKSHRVDRDERGDYVFAYTATAWEAWQAAVASQQPADDVWIEWGSGPCPVDGLVKVEVKLSGAPNEEDLAKNFCWVKCMGRGDIIAYRVVKS